MKTFDLYLDSGPMRKKTYVHVPALLGCIARGDTTDEAVERSPDAISTFLRFVAQHGETVDPREEFRVRVALHMTDSAWPGNGSGFLPVDEKPLTAREIDALMARLDAIHAGLRRLTGGLTAKQLDAKPATGRPIRGILQHVCGEGGYLRGVTGSSRLMREVEEGRIDPNDALDRLLALERERLRTMSKEERTDVIMRGQARWSARFAVRRMLEHAWEHYVEIADRLRQAP